MNIHKSATQNRNEDITNNILLLTSSFISSSVFPSYVSTALNFDIALKKVYTHTYMSIYTYMFVYVYSLATYSQTLHTYTYLKYFVVLYLFWTL